MLANPFKIVICVSLFISLFNCEDDEKQSVKKCDDWCPNGKRVSREIEPRFNGCGPKGVPEFLRKRIDEKLTACCNDHDICYEDCVKTKEECDAVFRSCMDRESSGKKGFVNTMKTAFRDIKKGKVTQSYGMPKLVEQFGCTPYKKSQERACLCVTDDQINV